MLLAGETKARRHQTPRFVNFLIHHVSGIALALRNRLRRVCPAVS
jgi:hypothetical protein